MAVKFQGGKAVSQAGVEIPEAIKDWGPSKFTERLSVYTGFRNGVLRSLGNMEEAGTPIGDLLTREERELVKRMANDAERLVSLMSTNNRKIGDAVRARQ